MNTGRPAESVELVTVATLPVQSVVTRAIAQPPGTPARPREDRPALSPSLPSRQNGAIADTETLPSGPLAPKVDEAP
jgi:hypothetical protein